jgi:ADP-heptose:LPS heptosyltransferase
MYCLQKLLKYSDLLAGKMLARLFTRPLGIVKNILLESIILIRPGGIGDAVLLAPAIKSLKKAYPDCHLTVLSEQRNAGVFALIPGVNEVLCYDRPRELVKALRGRYDVVIDTEQWYRLSAVVARLIRAPIKIGFDTNERRRMFTHGTRYDLDAYEPENFASLLKPLGVDCRCGAGDVTLDVPPQSVSKATQLLQPLCSESFVAIFPGASIPEKRWGTGRFRRVAELLSVFGIKTVVVGGKEDRRQGEVIAGGGSGLNLAGLTSLAETAAVIRKSALLLSGDSGVLHIAVGLGVPTVSLFGPGRTEKWAPRGDRHIVINKGLPCSPCTTFGNTPPCPHDTRCMRDITVDEVVNAVTMLLTSVGVMPSRCCKRDWIEIK